MNRCLPWERDIMNLRGALFLLTISLIGVIGGVLAAVLDHLDTGTLVRGVLVGGSTVNGVYAMVLLVALQRQRRGRL